MKIATTPLPGLVLLEPEVYSDRRGYLFVAWQRDEYAAAGIREPLVQDNLSFSAANVLRGLHYQFPHSQAKLVGVVHGEILDVAVDIRVGSPTFAQWFAVRLSEANRRQLYIPIGFAHGFAVLSDKAYVSYKCSDTYYPQEARTIRWNDPRLGIDWPLSDPTLSDQDAAAPTLDEMPAEFLPRYDESRGP